MDGRALQATFAAPRFGAQGLDHIRGEFYNQQGESAITRSSEAVTFERERVYLVAGYRHTAEDRSTFDITGAAPERVAYSMNKVTR